jgi:hypothetical protein
MLVVFSTRLSLDNTQHKPPLFDFEYQHLGLDRVPFGR